VPHLNAVQGSPRNYRSFVSVSVEFDLRITQSRPRKRWPDLFLFCFCFSLFSFFLLSEPLFFSFLFFFFFSFVSSEQEFDTGSQRWNPKTAVEFFQERLPTPRIFPSLIDGDFRGSSPDCVRVWDWSHATNFRHHRRTRPGHSRAPRDFFILDAFGPQFIVLVLNCPFFHFIPRRP